ncbi:fibronectin type III domain-containing protein 7-like [Phyllobates terribilis]|uniref:fibronectin type III domain-containing protein 7-like n=1 Tax=Phyllobates terribilis TaxID=111132 RepID=UPI003CCB012C
MAVFHGPDGSEASCVSSTTSCSVSNLECGQLYNVTVTAMDGSCHSITTNATTVTTVPCTPDVVEVNIDCLKYEALVSWHENNMYPTYHTAVAIDPLGNELSCDGFDTSCQMSGFECGSEYSFHVYSSNHQCKSLNSAVHKSWTAPCQPRDIITNVQCENNDALISWTDSKGALYYLATLSGNGKISACNTTTTQCSYPSLQCGQSYNVSVMAVNDVCDSALSAVSSFQTAPCQPQGLSIDLDCSSQTASMVWVESDGARIYTITIEGINGAVSSYTTTSTFFNSNVLACSQTYGFSVLAIGGTCNSSKSLTVYEITAPCAPLNVSHTRNCPTSMTSVTWSPSAGAIMYNVTTTETGGLEIYCHSPNTDCSLMGLSCGLSYDVKVEAVGQKCSSNTSSSLLLKTAPCLPNNTAVHIVCENDSAVLSWEASRGALDYVATVKYGEDVVYSCATETTSCVVSDLTCGASYSFSVLAKDMECNSSYTTPIGFGAVPCSPSEVETLIYRGSVKPQEVEITWNGSHCGSDYMATIQGQIGKDPESTFVLNSYWTSYMDFYIPVPCSSVYNVTVTARNPSGPSDPSSPIVGYTAPCTPQVKPIEIKDGKLLISWDETPYADEYRVVTTENSNIICTTPGLSCQVPLTSSAFQVIAVNPSGQSPPADLSGYN